jgi:DNA repair protein RadA/Sms
VPIAGAPRACFGELGLTGELRWVGHPERRLEEAARHGLEHVICPPSSGRGASEVATLRDALRAALPRSAEGERPRAERARAGPVALVAD